LNPDGILVFIIGSIRICLAQGLRCTFICFS
jgi:hypothetical protein